MKSIVLITLLFSFSLFSAHHVVTKIEINYGSKDGILVNKTSSGNYGILSFVMTGKDEVALLCNVEQKVKMFNISTNRLDRELFLNDIPEDFIYNNGVFYILAGYKIHVYSKYGPKFLEFPISNNFRFIERLRIVDDCLYVLTSRGNSYKVFENGRALPCEQQEKNFIKGWIFYDKGISFNTAKINDCKFLLRKFVHGDSVITEEKIFTVDKKLGSVMIIGIINDVIYFDVQYIVNDIPLEVERMILAYSLSSSEVLDKFKLPGIYYLYTKRDLITAENSMYHLVTTENSANVMSLLFDKDIDRTVYPEYMSYKYHYNNHLPKEIMEPFSPPVRDRPISQTRITRAQILKNADAYEKVEWVCSAANTTNHQVVQLPDGTLIRTPEWVTVGPKRKMPYKWGGFTHIDNFLLEIANGKYAGDDYIAREPGYSSRGDTYCVGVDCSGFVSRAWGREKQEWTGSLPNISYQLPGWENVQKGDIANNAGSHVMLIVENNQSGTLNIIEAGGDMRVSYRTYPIIYLTGYVPRKYHMVFDPLQAYRRTERAYIIRKDYGFIEFTNENSPSHAVLKYILYRKEAGGEYLPIEEFSSGFTYYDIFLDEDKTYTYKVESVDSTGQVVEISNEPTI